MERSRIKEGYPGPQELLISQQRDSDMKKVEIREREERRKERERKYTEKLRNGTRTRVSAGKEECKNDQ